MKFFRRTLSILRTSKKGTIFMRLAGAIDEGSWLYDIT